MHGLDGGGRERSAQQDAAVLIQGRKGGGLGRGRKLPLGPLARRNDNDPIHPQLPRRARINSRVGCSRQMP